MIRLLYRDLQRMRGFRGLRDENISCNLHSSLTVFEVEKDFGKNSIQWRKSHYCEGIYRYTMRGWGDIEAGKGLELQMNVVIIVLPLVMQYWW